MDGLLQHIGLGTALFWALAAAALFAAALSAVWAIRNRNRKRLLEPSLQLASTPGSQSEEIKRVLAEAGYAYDDEKNIYYTVRDPWQKEMGYCRLYDELAVPVGLVFDSEPVCFDYNGKKWLIEFWKGQYGITAGGEIGIYNTTRPDIRIPGFFNGTFYRGASDEESLPMEFTLKRNGNALFTRGDRHWWLTGFVLGEYSDPSALAMDVSVTFHSREMQRAFLQALFKLGYSQSEIVRSGNAVRFIFGRPRSRQPLLRRGIVNAITLRRNKALVAQFRKITQGMDGLYNILMALRTKSPLLYHMALRMGRQADLYRSYRVVRKYLT